MKNVAPSELSVHKQLEEVRPLSENKFELLKNDDLNDEDLTQEEVEYFDTVRNIGRDIQASGQINEALVSHKGGTPELISGYTRYLACKWVGEPLEVKTFTLEEDEDINELIFRENENRLPMGSYERAMVIAKRLGLWDHNKDKFIPPSDAEQNMTITEFAKKVGRTKQTIWEFLSPVRQNQEMREDFGDELNDTMFKLIEEVTDDDATQYSLAQALQMSEVDSARKFREIVQNVRGNHENQVPKYVTKELVGYEEEIEDDEEEESTPQKKAKKPKAQRIMEKREREAREQERQEKEENTDDFQNRISGLREKEEEEPEEIKSSGEVRDSEDDGRLTFVEDEDEDEDGIDEEIKDEVLGAKEATELEDGKTRVRGEFGTTLVVDEEEEDDTNEESGKLDFEPVNFSLEDDKVLGQIHNDAEEYDETPGEVVHRILTNYYGI